MCINSLLSYHNGIYNYVKLNKPCRSETGTEFKYKIAGRRGCQNRPWYKIGEGKRPTERKKNAKNKSSHNRRCCKELATSYRDHLAYMQRYLRASVNCVTGKSEVGCRTSYRSFWQIVQCQRTDQPTQVLPPSGEDHSGLQIMVPQRRHNQVTCQ